MGVSQFFKWSTEGRYAKDLEDFDHVIESSVIPQGIHHLFIDFIAFIFDVLNNVENSSPDVRFPYESMSQIELELSAIDLIIEALENYVKKIKPSLSVGIFADGVVPMARICWKRHSAFWSTYYKKRMKSIPLEESDIVPPSRIPLFRKIFIGIASPFMENLFSKIRERISIFGELKVTLSGVNIPGEGEHKIISHIRSEHIETENNIFIFSTDADTIFLSCLLPDNFIYMATRVNINPTVIDINKFMTNLFQAFRLKYQIEAEFKNFIFDFVFLCFFVGNDYIHHLPGFTVEYDGINLLLSIYANTLKSVHKYKRYFIYRENRKIKINNYFLKFFFANLSRNEQINLQTITQKRTEKYCLKEGWSDIKIAKNKVLYLAENEAYKKYHTPVNYFDSDWKQQYYTKIMNTDSRSDDYVKKYLTDIFFCTRMYFESVISWDWINQSYIAPLSSDIYYVISHNFFDINRLKLPIGEPVEPILQNMIIYPRYMPYYYPPQFLKILKNSKYDKYYIFNENNIFPYERDLVTDIPGMLPSLEEIIAFFKEFYGQHKHLLD